jgi:hypothetical protein
VEQVLDGENDNALFGRGSDLSGTSSLLPVPVFPSLRRSD